MSERLILPIINSSSTETFAAAEKKLAEDRPKLPFVRLRVVLNPSSRGLQEGVTEPPYLTRARSIPGYKETLFSTVGRPVVESLAGSFAAGNNKGIWLDVHASAVRQLTYSSEADYSRYDQDSPFKHMSKGAVPQSRLSFYLRSHLPTPYIHAVHAWDIAGTVVGTDDEQYDLQAIVLAGKGGGVLTLNPDMAPVSQGRLPHQAAHA